MMTIFHKASNIKEDYESFKQNPLRLCKLVNAEVDGLVTKAQKVEHTIHEKLLDSKQAILYAALSGSGDEEYDMALETRNNLNTTSSTSNLIRTVSNGLLNLMSDVVPEKKEHLVTSETLITIKNWIEHICKIGGGNGSILDRLPGGETMKGFLNELGALLKMFDDITQAMEDSPLVPSGCIFGMVSCCVNGMLHSIEDNCKDQWHLFLEEAHQIIGNFKAEISDNFINAFTTLKGISIQMVSDYEKSLSKAIELASSFPKMIIEGIKELADKYLSQFKGLKSIKELFSDITDKNFLSNTFSNLRDEVVNLMSRFKKFISDLIDSTLGPVVKFVKNVVKTVKDLFSKSYQAIIDTFNSLVELLKSIPKRIRDVFTFTQNCCVEFFIVPPTEFIEKAIKKAQEILDSIPVDNITTAFKELKESVGDFYKPQVMDVWIGKLDEIDKIEKGLNKQYNRFGTFSSDLENACSMIKSFENEGVFDWEKSTPQHGNDEDFIPETTPEPLQPTEPIQPQQPNSETVKDDTKSDTGANVPYDPSMDEFLYPKTSESTPSPFSGFNDTSFNFTDEDHHESTPLIKGNENSYNTNDDPTDGEDNIKRENVETGYTSPPSPPSYLDNF